jgi:hypothetical protein
MGTNKKRNWTTAGHRWQVLPWNEPHGLMVCSYLWRRGEKVICYADEKDKQQRWGECPAEADDEDDVYGNLFVDGGLGESLLRVKAGEVNPVALADQ